MKVFIYVLLDPTTKEVRYVGKTLNPKERHRKHLLRRENNYKYSWVKSLRGKGLKPLMGIIEELNVETDAEWQLAERWWIHKLKGAGCRLTNLNDGGIGGIRPCEETRKKMSEAHTGKKMTTETRAKLSASKKGVPKSDATRKKFSQRMIGWSPSEETRRKMAENARRHMTPERIALMKVASKTPEALAKMAAALRGRAHSEESRRKRSESMKGKVVHTKESRAVLSAKAKARMTPERVRYLTMCRINPAEAAKLREDCGFTGLPAVHQP